MRRFSISLWLAALLIATFVPLLIFLLFLVGQLKKTEDAALEQRTLRTADIVAQSVESIIENMSITLNLVSSSQELAEGDLQGFHRKTQFALEGSGSFVILTTQDGQQLLNTRVPYGTVLGRTSDQSGLNADLTSKSVHVSGVFKGKTSDEWVFNVVKLLPQNYASPARIAITTKNAEDIGSIFDNISLPEEWLALVVDSTGRVVASSDRSRHVSGDPVQNLDVMELNRFLNANPAKNLNKQDGIISASTVVGNSGWKVFINGPVSTAQQSVYETWRIVIFGSLFFAIVSIAFLYIFSDYLGKTIRAIARMARQLGAGEIVSPINSRISEIDVVAKALSDASFDRSQHESTITMVSHELAHRTKNLIAVVISMVRQTSRHASSTEAMTKLLTDRIMGLSFSIDLLTSQKWGGVLLNDLLAKQLFNYGTIGQNVILSGPELKLRAEAVQHLGMAIHELATNAVKYGSLKTSAGRVHVSWEITASDSGPKLKLVWQELGGQKVDMPSDSGFGTQILERFAASALGGLSELNYEETGLIWSLTVPVEAIVETTSAE